MLGDHSPVHIYAAISISYGMLKHFLTTSNLPMNQAIGEWFIRIFALLNGFYTVNVIKDALAFLFKFIHEKREGHRLQRQMEILTRKGA